MTIEERLIQLESKLIYAENTILEMNKTLISQKQDLSTLIDLFDELNNKIHEINDGSNNQPMGFEKPPHY